MIDKNYNKTTERFWNKVNISSHDQCWLWEASCSAIGYGYFSFNGKMVGAHRYSFFLAQGYFPSVVMHICDNPLCCNPSHLLAGTQALNMVDRDVKGRNGHSRKTHCPSGHEYNLQNTYIYSTGGRKCRECNRLRQIKLKLRRQ